MSRWSFGARKTDNPNRAANRSMSSRSPVSSVQRAGSAFSARAYFFSTGGVSGVIIGALFAFDDGTALIGWQTASAQGVDMVGKDNRRVTSYGAYADSPLFRVGSPARKRTFAEAEFQLEKPLTTGQGVKLQYRTDTAASWTDIVTIDYATDGGAVSYCVPASIADVERLQVRVLLTSYASGTTSPILTEVRLR